MAHVHVSPSPIPAAPALALLLVALIYFSGWFAEHANGAKRLPGWRAFSFLAGLLFIWLAIGTPLAVLDHESLTAHMVQHLLLMTFGPPLIWLGAPAMAQRARLLSHLASGWLFSALVILGWHFPPLFTLGMRSSAWHVVEHASFLMAGLLFWLPVALVGSQPKDARWSIVVYLFFATFPCDVLAGFMVFSERVAYPIYLGISQHTRASVLVDQACAGALMWTCVTIVYLAVGAIVTTKWLAVPARPRIDASGTPVEVV